eukprot:CAMPEP_0115052378 /NCGR_PEP_ID=MMETSP0227-20121206/2901_1 /TAXON_ID=89957 /ORGANISM="Polarella glacialis, Strain CCMP 1383" /LENGTH=608 /DNA_ID=CAMNT_0002436527 /DNA_START=119 /DNA_END=1942 /DNA_ORIENTATION=-
MAPAAFHLQDVERVRDNAPEIAARWVQANGPREHDEVSDLSMMEAAATAATSGSSAAHGQMASTAGKLTTPRKRRKHLGSEAVYYRRGQDADLRWHVPLQDAARPGKASGLVPLSRGQEMPLDAAADVVRFCAARPRPACTPPPVPSSLEAEGCLFIGSGGLAVRQVLCNVEPVSALQQLASKGDQLDAVLQIDRHFDASARHGFQLDSVRAVGIKMTGDASNVKDSARQSMMGAVAGKLQSPEWMVLTDLPVLPPDLRTRSMSDPMAFPDDLNLLYKGISFRANNLLRDALQQAVDSLIDNGRLGKPELRKNGQELESVAMRLKGKEGRMRSNMLGKRVDFSARTVIVVEPKLELDQCGLPYAIARSLFSGFLAGKCASLGDCGAQLPLEWFDEQPKATRWELLRGVMENRAVMLNRAPTLHRLGCQAFLPQLIEGQALKIHPLVCAPFNADFDGDTMTMHLALSDAAQKEFRELMMPTRNLSSPATGDPVIGPTQDMVLGIYYLTADPPEQDVPPTVCETWEHLEAVVSACAAGELSHGTVLSVPKSVLAEAAPEAAEDDPVLAIDENSDGSESVRTTAGRALFFLMVHKGFTPPMRKDLVLLDYL